MSLRQSRLINIYQDTDFNFDEIAMGILITYSLKDWQGALIKQRILYSLRFAPQLDSHRTAPHLDSSKGGMKTRMNITFQSINY